MDKELSEQFQMLIDIMGNMPTKEDIKESETRINIKIENEVTKRIDSLFDGYKLAHEKQYELEREFERRTSNMQAQLDNLQARIYEIEKKTASAS